MSCVTKSIFPCFETLKAVDGEVQHLAFHQARFDKTRKNLYGVALKMALSDHVLPPKEGIYRVRVEYAEELHKIEYIPYVPRTIQTLALVEARIDYAYKYCNRECLYKHSSPDVDDVLFTFNDELKDTSIANIALFIDGEWKTPSHPLLEGTTRARLIASGFLKCAELGVKSLPKADKFAIMNSLIGFKIIKNVCIKD